MIVRQLGPLKNDWVKVKLFSLLLSVTARAALVKGDSAYGEKEDQNDGDEDDDADDDVAILAPTHRISDLLRASAIQVALFNE